MASALASFVIVQSVPTALAGGSSYSLKTIPHMGLIKNGHVLPDALQINVQTYFNTSLSQINQISINTVKLSCEGDDALESADLSLGGKTLASAQFVPSTIANNWYKAILQPENLILENDSAYNFSINLKAGQSGAGNLVALCRAEIIDHTQMKDGKANSVQDTGYMYQSQTNTAMIVTTASDSIFNNASTYRNIDLNNGYVSERSLTVYGDVNKVTGGYQFTAWNTDWVAEGLHNVLNSFYDTPGLLTFDVKTPAFFNLEELKYSGRYEIVEMHLYDKQAANGSIGTLSLKRY